MVTREQDLQKQVGRLQRQIGRLDDALTMNEEIVDAIEERFDATNGTPSPEATVVMTTILEAKAEYHAAMLQSFQARLRSLSNH